MENNNFSYQFYHTTTEAWDAMYQAILTSQKSIYWEVYSLIDDAAGERFIEALCAKASSGVEVKIIIDAVGSFGLSGAAESRLRLAGAEVMKYNRLNLGWSVPAWINRLWKRNHRKVLLIDDEIAFLGGVNIEAPASEWYDLHLKITGKVVRPLLRAFAKSYVRSGGDKREVRQFLHPKLTGGLTEWRQKINFIIHSPTTTLAGGSLLRRVYHGALELARESFTLITPYYVPDKKFLQLIARAKRRGVKVNIILPYRTDHRLMHYLSRTFFDLTERAGAALYFLRKMNHGKAFSVDNQAGLVGSSNLTPRSFFINEEAGAYFNDERMVSDLNKILVDWKEEAVPLAEVGGCERGWHSRFVDWLAKRFKDYV